MPIRNTQDPTSGLGIDTGKRPDHVWSCVGPLLVRSLLAWSRLWSKHEMHATELSDEVESEVPASAVCERVQMRESLSNVYWDKLLCI